jgi:hypothetical protein
MKLKIIFNSSFIILVTFLFLGCSKNSNKELIHLSANELHTANISLEKDIVHDFFSPPVASRIYLYPNLIAYEVLTQKTDKYASLQAIFSDFPVIHKYDSEKTRPLAALYCFYAVANELVYTNKNLLLEIARLDSTYADLPELSKIKKYTKEVSKQLFSWMKEDGYDLTRNMGDYTLLKTKGSWKPTPPDFLDALEPNWGKMRPLVLDSASQFRSVPPILYDLSENSEFKKELLEVYEIVKNKTATTIEIAKFWDCNPIIVVHNGHFAYSEKKLTPGGHWMNICRSAAINTKQDIEATAYAYTSLSIGVFDAFIVCWDTKYATDYIRPVTVIQNEMDPGWSTILVTPNFPEYTRGHSVVSKVASMTLTAFFGENYAFTDSTEVPYGMPPRSFKSFQDASDEAAISRFYGGIHYKTGVYKGVEQGELIGNVVLKKLKKLKNETD